MTRPSTTLSTKIEAQAEALYGRYRFPDRLRTHSLLVGRISGVLAEAHAVASADLEIADVALAGYLVRALEREVFAPPPFGPAELAGRIRTAWP